MSFHARKMGRTAERPFGSGGGSQVFEWKFSRMSRLRAAWSRTIMSRVLSIFAFHAPRKSSTAWRERMYTSPVLWSTCQQPLCWSPSMSMQSVVVKMSTCCIGNSLTKTAGFPIHPVSASQAHTLNPIRRTRV